MTETETIYTHYRATCPACGWESPDHWRRYDEAASDLYAHFRETHPASITELTVKRTVIEEIVVEAPVSPIGQKE